MTTVEFILFLIVGGAAALVLWIDLFRVAQNERVARSVAQSLRANERYIEEFLMNSYGEIVTLKRRVNALIDLIEAQNKAAKNDLN